MDNQKKTLREEDIDRIIGGLGMANPASGISKEQAVKIATELGDGKDEGSYKTMTGDQFMDWWKESNK